MLGLAAASVICAGGVSAASYGDEQLGSAGAATEADADERFRIEHALEAQAQGGLSGYLVDIADALVGPAALLHDRQPADEKGGTDDAQMTAAQFRVEHAREAKAEGGLSGYPEDEQVWMDRE